MPIEWGNYQNESAMSVSVIDNTDAPTTVLDAGSPFNVVVRWNVPSGQNTIIGGNFRVRLFAESYGPGFEGQIGGTSTVSAVAGQAPYTHTMTVAANELPGEGVSVGGGEFSSGVYKIVAVLQHVNGGPNEVSGFAESAPIQVRTP